ncbi:unnamed protein product [Urochloa humidicola]
MSTLPSHPSPSFLLSNLSVTARPLPACFLFFSHPIEARVLPPLAAAAAAAAATHLLPLLLLHIRHHSLVRWCPRRRGARHGRSSGRGGRRAAAITAHLWIRRGMATAGTSGLQIERSARRHAALFPRRKIRTRRRVSLHCHPILARSASTFSGQQAELKCALAVDYSAPASSNPSPARPMVVVAPSVSPLPPARTPLRSRFSTRFLLPPSLSATSEYSGAHPHGMLPPPWYDDGRTTMGSPAGHSAIASPLVKVQQ